jgi:integrase
MLGWTVTPATQKRYRGHVMEFLEWMIQNDEDAEDVEEFDDLLLDFVHHLYESGRGKTAANMTMAGLRLFLPQLEHRLPKSTQAIQGWNKRCPGRSYPPLTLHLAVAVSVQLARNTKIKDAYRKGVGVLAAFDCFLRVGELCNLRREDVADAGDSRVGSEHKGMVLRLRKTKTGTNQEVRVVTPSVITLLRGLVAKTKPGERLFPFTADTFRRNFKAACAELGLSPDYVPHSLRHGGATRYRHVLGWSMEDIMQRGRWASTKSARRYVQSGMAMLLEMSAPKHIDALASTMAQDPVLYLSLTQKHSVCAGSPHH